MRRSIFSKYFVRRLLGYRQKGRIQPILASGQTIESESETIVVVFYSKYRTFDNSQSLRVVMDNRNSEWNGRAGLSFLTLRALNV